MSRAFMFETDGMFHCTRMDRDCPDANLRGGCDLDRCRHEGAGEASEGKAADEKIQDR